VRFLPYPLCLLPLPATASQLFGTSSAHNDLFRGEVVRVRWDRSAHSLCVALNTLQPADARWMCIAFAPVRVCTASSNSAAPPKSLVLNQHYTLYTIALEDVHSSTQISVRFDSDVKQDEGSGSKAEAESIDTRPSV
jgi:hypothetical protein